MSCDQFTYDSQKAGPMMQLSNFYKESVECTACLFDSQSAAQTRGPCISNKFEAFLAQPEASEDTRQACAHSG